MTVKPLTEYHLEFLSLKGGCTDLSESILVKMPHCWKSYVAAHLRYIPKIFHGMDNPFFYVSICLRTFLVCADLVVVY